MSVPIDGSAETFDDLVLSSDRPVVVDFWAEWCAPCHMIAVWMNNLAAAHPDRLNIVKIDADENRELARSLGVMGLPTILMYNQGELLHRQTDELTEIDLAALVQEHLGIS
jgi:thioredoxin 1